MIKERIASRCSVGTIVVSSVGWFYCGRFGLF